jgi:hypothetical protein
MTILLSLLFFCNTVFSQSRVENHDHAVKALSNLNFFKNGRGMIISPDMIKLYDQIGKKYGIGAQDAGILNKRWGVNLVDKKIKGIFTEDYKGMKIGVLGCVACHSGKAAGEYIVGLGNKTIDVGQIGQDVYLAQLLWGQIPRPNNLEFNKIHNRALEFTKGLSNQKVTNETQGLVPTSLIRSWFYKVQNQHFPEETPKGLVKVPHLWGYGEKRKSGSFTDGEGDGTLPGWAIAVELYAGQTVENVRTYLDKVHAAEDYLSDLLPPKYPFTINKESAIRGEKIFSQTCSKCHGTYERDSNGLPIYTASKHIPLRIVQTDSKRLDALTPELYDLIASGPLNDIMKTHPQDEKGYVAPLLWGVWARFPYLHNGSVPTITDLLSHPDQRPKIFSLFKAGERERFDEKNLGIIKSIIDPRKSDRSTYDTSRSGHSNQGHYFKSFETLSPADKSDLIEYLKTL